MSYPGFRLRRSFLAVGLNCDFKGIRRPGLAPGFLQAQAIPRNLIHL